MFSLENSAKFQYRENNWNIIEKFIKKNEIELKNVDYKSIISGNKTNLLNFIIAMYEILTRKKFFFNLRI